MCVQISALGEFVAFTSNRARGYATRNETCCLHVVHFSKFPGVGTHTWLIVPKRTGRNDATWKYHCQDGFLERVVRLAVKHPRCDRFRCFLINTLLYITIVISPHRKLATQHKVLILFAYASADVRPHLLVRCRVVQVEMWLAALNGLVAKLGCHGNILVAPGVDNSVRRCSFAPTAIEKQIHRPTESELS